MIDIRTMHSCIDKLTSDLDSFLDLFSSENMLKGRKVIRKEGQIYLVDGKMIDVMNDLSAIEGPFHAGIYLGEQFEQKFYPSLMLLDLISRSGKTDRKIMIKEKPAWLFMCGRDIQKKSISKIVSPYSGLVLVQNDADENLGLGYFLGEKGTRDDQMVILNVIDRGSFLRRELN